MQSNHSINQLSSELVQYNLTHIAYCTWIRKRCRSCQNHQYADRTINHVGKQKLSTNRKFFKSHFYLHFSKGLHITLAMFCRAQIQMTFHLTWLSPIYFFKRKKVWIVANSFQRRYDRKLVCRLFSKYVKVITIVMSAKIIQGVQYLFSQTFFVKW